MSNGLTVNIDRQNIGTAEKPKETKNPREIQTGELRMYDQQHL